MVQAGLSIEGVISTSLVDDSKIQTTRDYNIRRREKMM